MSRLTEDQELDYRATVRIRDCAEDVAVYVATWQDDRLGGTARRQALTEAVDAIDSILRSAHALRQSLVSRGRLFDDEAMRRSGDCSSGSRWSRNHDR